jgi:hypothetical protein
MVTDVEEVKRLAELAAKRRDLEKNWELKSASHAAHWYLGKKRQPGMDQKRRQDETVLMISSLNTTQPPFGVFMRLVTFGKIGRFEELFPDSELPTDTIGLETLQTLPGRLKQELEKHGRLTFIYPDGEAKGVFMLIGEYEDAKDRVFGKAGANV